MSADMGLAVDAVRLAMNLEQLRARTAARNIAMVNVPGAPAMRVDVAGALAAARGSRHDDNLFAQNLEALARQDLDVYLRDIPTSTPLALDSEVAEMSAASGRYQALAEGVSRQFGLMQLAIKGGR
ncbi:flagellar biosynthesis protein FlgB [Pseudomonas sp. LLC-1]|uniref:flagellar biosynthesis protein FlgB n=1 Tax=Pseudomonas sp. LLC-1 TaxID=1812180 RepID=UPI000D01A723|nr:flagellar biosynthesis protein FlgB [Pseudomonas sp. LLC-1]PRN02998.1 flagellar biosynthesis protein FlgB [Pseudomonas sp. LLC-1]